MGRTLYKSIDESFWGRVLKPPIGLDEIGKCWIWIGPRSRWGYGLLSYQGIRAQAHRFSWEIHNGEIPPRLLVCHSCDNPPCVRPEHLWLGTNQENTRDAQVKSRLGKVSAQDVLDIRAAVARGGWGCQMEQARIYGVTHSCVYAIVNRKTWTHI